ncbi:phosphatidate cytidylyltransferase [Microtetraspora sp. AC03309]|uniref:phosphatidate cytidylyltransferase n=1 Tax=Microtetraspora sp. AC03309 TaxID=2779376 RepID=UPI001E4E6C1A|nr:phosphatidate cytidylyltransferase [Microtetraspora sp. AC03309]
MDGTAAGDRDSAENMAGSSSDGRDAARNGSSNGSPDGSAGPAAGGSRTGRNLPVAIAVGVALGVLVIGSLYVVKVVFLLVVLAAVGLGVHELVRALAARGVHAPLVPSLAGTAAMLGGAYWGGPVSLVGAFALTVMVLLTWRMFQGIDGYVRDATGSVLVAAYPSLLAGFVALLLVPDDGPDRVVIFIAVTVCSDIGGYFAGILFGKHKMSPIISPKKTWEGFTGSAVACVVAGALLVHFLLDGAYWQGAIVGAVVVVCATLGDLIESVIKRDLGIKDMGTLLPGHGGVMDRLDSLLFTLVPVWLLLQLFIPS